MLNKRAAAGNLADVSSPNPPERFDKSSYNYLLPTPESGDKTFYSNLPASHSEVREKSGYMNAGEKSGYMNAESMSSLLSSNKVCKFCGKIFTTWNNLNHHERIHTGEKPHACLYCPYRSAQHGNLQRHVKSQHPGVIQEIPKFATLSLPLRDDVVSLPLRDDVVITSAPAKTTASEGFARIP